MGVGISKRYGSVLLDLLTPLFCAEQGRENKELGLQGANASDLILFD